MIDPTELRDVFDRAASLSPQERAGFLARACGDNETLRHEVERLLAADARLGSIFDTQPASDRATDSAASAAPLLQSGRRLGPYEIVAALGAGGMGEVYKARDARLDRTVAIKVLSHDLTGDASARQRFDREARAVAALSHPHICPLFDIGHQDGIDFLVMEFLDGETLASRLRRGRLSLDDALTCATHVADALAAAHRAGIVHRDLKPANIMLTASGVKLLDFGLAKRQGASIPSDMTRLAAEPLTHSGTILGTVEYMAPEQLEGRAVNQRTDIFAFGVVLYEMLTGRRAFSGGSHAAVIGNILHSEPPAPSSIERLTPRSLDDLVRICLAKNPDQRWQSAAVLRDRLSSLPDLAAPARRRIGRFAATALILLVMAVVGLGLWRLSRTSLAKAPVNGVPAQHDLTRLTFENGLQTDPTFSPDGRFIAYSSNRAGNFDIWVQPVAAGDAVQVTKSPAHDLEPSWSPDGSTIASRSERDGGGVYLVPALGGPERLLVRSGTHPAWSADGMHIRYLARAFEEAKLYVVALTGQPPHEIFPEVTASGSWNWIWPHPDGRMSFFGVHKKLGFGFYTASPSGTITSSDLTRLPAQISDMVHAGGQRFYWTNRGTELFLETAADNAVQNLWKVRVNPSTLAWLSAERLTTGAGADVASALSPDGRRLVFSTQRRSQRVWRYTFNPVTRRLLDGRPLTEDAVAHTPDVGGDGRSIVYALLRPGLEEVNLWLTRLDSRHSEFFAKNALGPVWSADRRHVAFTKFRPESDGKSVDVPTALAVRDVAGREELVSPWNTETAMAVSDWTADNRALLARVGGRLVIWPVVNSPAARPERIVLARNDVELSQARISPNGRWLAVVIHPAKQNGSQLGVTSANGSPNRLWRLVAESHPWVDSPRWSSDGRRLFFLTVPPGASMNLWGIDFDAESGRFIGEPFDITSFDSPDFKLSPSLIWRPGMSMLGREVFVPMDATAGNLWMLDNVDR